MCGCVIAFHCLVRWSLGEDGGGGLLAIVLPTMGVGHFSPSFFRVYLAFRHVKEIFRCEGGRPLEALLRKQ